MVHADGTGNRMTYAKRTINRGPEVFLRECRALGIRIELRNGRIVVDELAQALKPYIKAHYAELVAILEGEQVTA